MTQLDIPRGAGCQAAPPADQTADPAADQTVVLNGRIDVLTAGDLRVRLHGAIDAGRGELRVDVAKLELLDNAGLGVLVGGARRARRAGRALVLVDVPAAIADLFRTDSMIGLLRIEATGS